MDHLLKKFGLDQGEVAVYTACLQREINTPSSISRDTGIKRTTVYLYIEKLKKKSLLKILVKKNKSYYAAISPEIGFKNYLEDKKQQLSEEEQLVEELEKYIQVNKEERGKTSVSYFDDNEGVKNLITKIISTRDDLYWLGNFEFLLKAISDKKLYSSFTVKRLNQATSSYAITDKSITKYAEFYDPKVGFRQYRFFKEVFNIPALIILFGEYTCLVSIENDKPRIVLVEDKTMTAIVLFMFKFLWNHLNEVSP